MAGKIRRIWDALEACTQANEEPLTSGQIIAWIGIRYPESDFHPVTLRAQIYRSCVNVPFAQKYDAPKILYYDKRSRTYSRVNTGVGNQDDQQDEVDVSVLSESDPDENSLEPEDQSDLLVGVEAQLRDYLAKNLGRLENGLLFWNDSPPSVEFGIGGRRIDILAKDTNGIPVVVELKRHKAYDRVVGQALLYQALVSQKFKTPRVRVILVANELSNELRLACSLQRDFKLFEYELTMQLNPILSGTIEEEA